MKTSSNPAAAMGSNALRYRRKTGLGWFGGSGEVSGSGSGMGRARKAKDRATEDPARVAAGRGVAEGPGAPVE